MNVGMPLSHRIAVTLVFLVVVAGLGWLIHAVAYVWLPREVVAVMGVAVGGLIVGFIAGEEATKRAFGPEFVRARFGVEMDDQLWTWPFTKRFLRNLALYMLGVFVVAGCLAAGSALLGIQP